MPARCFSGLQALLSLYLEDSCCRHPCNPCCQWPLNGKMIGKRQNGSTHQSCWFDKGHSCRQMLTAMILEERNLMLRNAFALTIHTKMYGYISTHTYFHPGLFLCTRSHSTGVICTFFPQVWLEHGLHCHSRMPAAIPHL